MKRFLGYLSPYRLEAVLGPLFKMLEALLELLIPLVVADIIDVGIATGDRAYIFSRVGLMVLLGVVGLAFSITAQYFSAKAAVGVATDMRYALFSHIGRLSHEATDRFGTATLLSRTTADIAQISTATNMVLRLFLRSPFIVFGAMIMAFTVSPHAALVFLVTIPLLSVVVFGIMIVSIRLARRVAGGLDLVLRNTREGLHGARVIRAFVREQETVNHFREDNAAYTRLQRFTGRFTALLNPLTYVIINLSVLAIIWRGGVEVDGGAISQGAVVALYNYMSQILVELIKLAGFIILITKACAAGSRINRIFDTPAGLPVSSAPKTPTKPLGAVSFEGASLAYHQDADAALSNITFSAAPGEVIGIIGGTGTGKSSLISLIPRFYDVTAGRVTVGGIDVRDFESPEALRAHIGVVPQRAELFQGTVRDNLTFGSRGATDAELLEALTAAQAMDFVAEKGGLDAELTAGGKNLSGGQRQRLTVARALVRRPDILILDDSASALDYATDAALRAALKALPYRPTTFIVSQRTASILHADRIIVLEEGRAVAIGTHKELLATCALYREIHATQFGEGEVGA